MRGKREPTGVVEGDTFTSLADGGRAPAVERLPPCVARLLEVVRDQNAVRVAVKADKPDDG